MITTIVQKAKEIHPTTIMLVHVGKFFKVYGKDAFIVSYHFNYKLTKDNGGIPTCGFVDKLIPKVASKLEDEKINYFILERKENYEIVENKDFKDLNKYEKNFERAKIYGNNMMLLNEIVKNINSDIYSVIMNQKLNKILRIIKDE